MLAQLLCAVVGLWVMVAPVALGYAGVAATVSWIAGPLALSFALIAAWEATRAVRWATLGVGAGLLLAALLPAAHVPARASFLSSGVLLVILSSLPGRRRHSFAGGWRALWR